MPQHLKTDPRAWQSLMSKFGLSDNDDTYRRLIIAYSERHRAYHTLDHITACLKHLEVVKHLTENPHEIELALWFHDVIYNPFSASNEDDSAVAAKVFLTKNAVNIDIISRIEDLIILTKDHTAPQTCDAKWMIDIDLSILGAPENVYAEFEKNVRKEYKRVPAFIFKKKRKAILQSFLERERLYYTDYFKERYEPQARSNLEWAIEAL